MGSSYTDSNTHSVRTPWRNMAIPENTPESITKSIIMEVLQIKWLHKPGYARTTTYVQKLFVMKGTKLIATSLLFIEIIQGNVSVGSF